MDNHPRPTKGKVLKVIVLKISLKVVCFQNNVIMVGPRLFITFYSFIVFRFRCSDCSVALPFSLWPLAFTTEASATVRDFTTPTTVTVSMETVYMEMDCMEMVSMATVSMVDSMETVCMVVFMETVCMGDCMEMVYTEECTETACMETDCTEMDYTEEALAIAG